MKVFTVPQIQEADAYTIQNEPIASIDLMERASQKVFDFIQSRFVSEEDFLIFCGTGNNGGDGFAIARMLLLSGKNVHVVFVNLSSSISADCAINKERFEKAGGAVLPYFPTKELPKLSSETVVVDAIFGSGLTRPIQGDLATLIKEVNQTPNWRVAIDSPSGLFADDNSKNGGQVFQAHYTLSFQFPKRAFFLPEFGKYVGEFLVLDIGLDPEHIARIPSKTFFLTEAMCLQIRRPRLKFDHKGTYGHLAVVGGSEGKMGSCILAAKAALKAGVGLVSLRIPSCGLIPAQSNLPEAMILPDEHEKELQHTFSVNEFRSISVGMGMGSSESATQVLSYLLKNFSSPLVLDADALNIVSENKTWLSFLPPFSILTPHLGELKRLVGDWKSDEEMLDKAQELATKFSVYVLVKGAHSCVCCPEGEQYFNSTGNPGMATAGSGDVLAGIIGALLCQGYDSKQAACLAMYYHGKAGDLACAELGQLSTTASSIIEYLPVALIT